MVDKENKKSKTKVKRPSKGMRRHIRRMKQAARKEGIEYKTRKVIHVPAKPAEEKPA